MNSQKRCVGTRHLLSALRLTRNGSGSSRRSEMIRRGFAHRIAHRWDVVILVIGISGMNMSQAQQEECRRYQVRHEFRVCLGENQIPRINWSWNVNARAWRPAIGDRNQDSQFYAVPNSDCKQAVAETECSFADARACFEVRQVGNCLVGFHELQGQACAFRRGCGAESRAQSAMRLDVGNLNKRTGQISWRPRLRDRISGRARVQIDPVTLILVESTSGNQTSVEIFRLEGSGFELQDGLLSFEQGATGFIRIYVQGPFLVSPEGSLVLEYVNGVVVNSLLSGALFANVSLPAAGDLLPAMIPTGIPEYQLAFDISPQFTLEAIDLSGSGEQDLVLAIQGDVNDDGCVDDADLLVVLFAFGGSNPLADVNGDGSVDDADLLIVLFNFGNGC
ncbi:MAG: hypothetical protein KatS3mg020_0778 [Fimbriimonadales bacterium]|nr:MAG: hypothetical protein KatS3mg020_0778 [Fimbriimonadales bacterium]